MKPVMRYHGGKFRLAEWVIGFFPEHQTYVEPFGGAAGVLMQKERSYAEIYNDLDQDVVNVFRVLRDPELSERLTEQLVFTPYSRDEFSEAYNSTSCPVEQARRTIIRASMGFGSAGSTKSTGFRCDMMRLYGTASHVWAKYPSAIGEFCERLSGVLIENRPAIEVMRQYDSPSTLHYVDPPYMHETRVMRGNLYNHEMSKADHESLIETVQSLEGFVVLSGYDTKLYNSGLAGWTQFKTKSRIAAGRGSKVKTECIWVNPQCHSAQPQSQLFGF